MGCAVGPDYKPPSFEADEWSEKNILNNEDTETNISLAQWWKGFKDPLLEELIIEAMDSNLELKIAEQRIIEARALRKVSRADFFPSFGSDIGVTRQKQSLNNPNFPQGPGINIPRYQSVYDAGFDASWEIDLFGKTRRAVEAATANIQREEAERRDITLSVISEIALNYVELRGVEKRLNYVTQKAELQEQIVALNKASYENDLIRETELAEAETELADMQSQIPPLQTERRIAAYRLGVLTSAQPGALLKRLENHKQTSFSLISIPVGLKSDLLRRRPDIQSAERNLAEATANKGVAIASLYPSFNLTAGIGVLSGGSSTLFEQNSENFTVTPLISIPILQAGRLRAQIEATDARVKIAAAQYEQTILNALEDAEASLTHYLNEQKTFTKLQEAEKSAARTVGLEADLYDLGLTRQVALIESQQEHAKYQDIATQSETRMFKNLISFYKALGGGWENFAIK
ncbi:MAG: efflux transporter outer membrane subunit [Pseudomonadota bacterium]